ncbi:flagellar basal body-associated FliL family protein [Devosia sp. CN2-171]|jgi:flagellar FliL protein|uniref:flagellar basal body-associated FliL family protein n=1 Tax=Devosia sp. CN2-171 TaxID=3400909 RepID=UPI003BF9057D
MAAEADIESGEVAAPEKKKLPVMLIAMVAAVVVLLGGGAGAYFMFFSAPAEDQHIAALPETFIFNLPTMTVNLRGEGEREQFMKLTVALEVANEEVMEEIQPRMAKVVDAFQVYLRELRKSDLEGSAGIYRLKEELRRRVNIAIFPAQVESILFKEILVQ